MTPKNPNWLNWWDVALFALFASGLGLLALLMLSIYMKKQSIIDKEEFEKKWKDINASDELNRKIREIDLQIKKTKARYAATSAEYENELYEASWENKGRGAKAAKYEARLSEISRENSLAKAIMRAEVGELERAKRDLMYPESKILTEEEQMALEGKMPLSNSPQKRIEFYRKWRWDKEVKAGFEIEHEFERSQNTFLAGAPKSYNWRNMPFQDNSFYEYKNSFRDYFTIAVVMILIVYVASWDKSPTYYLIVHSLFFLAVSSWLFDTFDRSWLCAVVPTALYLIFAHCGLIDYAMPYLIEWFPDHYFNKHYNPIYYKTLAVTLILDDLLKAYLLFLLFLKELIEWYQNERSFIWRRLAHGSLFDLKRRSYEGYVNYLKEVPYATYYYDAEWKKYPKYPNKNYALIWNARTWGIIIASIVAIVIVVKWYFFEAPFPTIAIWLWILIRLFKYFEYPDSSWFWSGVWLGALSVAWHYNLAAMALEVYNSYYPHLKGHQTIILDISHSPWKWRFVFLDVFLIKIFALAKAKENMDNDLWETSFYERAPLTPFDLRPRTGGDKPYNPWLINLDRGLPRDSEAWRKEPYLFPWAPYRLKRSPRNYIIFGLLGWLIYTGAVHGYLFVLQDQVCFFVSLALFVSCLFEEYDWSWHLALLFTAIYARITHLDLLYDFLEYFWEDFYDIAGPAVRAETLEVWITCSHVIYAALIAILLIYKIVKSDGFISRKLTGRLFDLEIISR